MNRKLIALSIVVIGFIAAGAWALNHFLNARTSSQEVTVAINSNSQNCDTTAAKPLPQIEPSAIVPQTQPSADADLTPAPPAIKGPVAVDTTQPPAPKAKPKSPKVTKAQKSSGGAPAQGGKPSESEGEPPIARAALSFVGMDVEAEQIWIDSINDTSIPPAARKNLIEDLNEDGFPDPKHMTADDVPLILNRMALIEDLAPNSVDDTNADAFAEAYKDLTDMLNKATGG